MLQDQIDLQRNRILTDGYAMSIGEILNLYADNELIIDPEFQRHYRWTQEQKTSLIESLLLGIPIPSIFVYQTDSGVWELIDGLQRISTLLEFTKNLKTVEAPLELLPTKRLPLLKDHTWDTLTTAQRLTIRRTRLRIEIIKESNNSLIKYELFKRLNTGGIALSPQELRNCLTLAIAPDLQSKLLEVRQYPAFQACIDLPDEDKLAQLDLEMVIRFMVGLHIEPNPTSQTAEILDEGIQILANTAPTALQKLFETFKQVFSLLSAVAGKNSFKPQDGHDLCSNSDLGAFDSLAVGIGKNIDSYLTLNEESRKEVLRSKVKEFWENDILESNSDARYNFGVRVKLGTQHFEAS